eukprot:EG_transcript_4533
MDFERHASYVHRFGTHTEWNGLYDVKAWQPAVGGQGSENVQRAHFCAFFHAREHLSNPLPRAMKLADVMRIVLHGLHRFVGGGAWLRFHQALRMRLYFRRRVVPVCRRLAAAREAVLDEWLAYWREAEHRAKEELRSQVHSKRLAYALGVRRSGQQALAHALAATPDCMKVKVLWQLYWLLRLQTASATNAYWREWFLLRAMREAFLVSPPPPSRRDFSPRREPLSLRAVNAALFVKALQAPHFTPVAGRDVTFKELVRLANAPNVPFVHEKGTATLLHVPSSVVIAFQTSPLCTDTGWLLSRLHQPLPVVPPLSWHPVLPQGDEGDLRPEELEGESELVVEVPTLEHKASLHHRRLQPHGAASSLSPIRVHCSPPDGGASTTKDGLLSPLPHLSARQSSQVRSPAPLSEPRRTFSNGLRRSRSPLSSLVDPPCRGGSQSLTSTPSGRQSSTFSSGCDELEQLSSPSSTASSRLSNNSFTRVIAVPRQRSSKDPCNFGMGLVDLCSVDPPQSPGEGLPACLSSSRSASSLSAHPRPGRGCQALPQPRSPAPRHGSKLEFLLDGTAFLKSTVAPTPGSLPGKGNAPS